MNRNTQFVYSLLKQITQKYVPSRAPTRIAGHLCGRAYLGDPATCWVGCLRKLRRRHPSASLAAMRTSLLDKSRRKHWIRLLQGVGRCVLRDGNSCTRPRTSHMRPVDELQTGQCKWVFHRTNHPLTLVASQWIVHPEGLGRIPEDTHRKPKSGTRLNRSDLTCVRTFQNVSRSSQYSPSGTASGRPLVLPCARCAG